MSFVVTRTDLRMKVVECESHFGPKKGPEVITFRQVRRRDAEPACIMLAGLPAMQLSDFEQ